MDLIYCVEDDDDIRDLVVYALKSSGFEAEGFGLPSQFWKAVESKAPSMVLLDIMLPEEDGIFLTDMETGKSRLLISYGRLAEIYGYPAEQKILVNHITAAALFASTTTIHK